MAMDEKALMAFVKRRLRSAEFQEKKCFDNANFLYYFAGKTTAYKGIIEWMNDESNNEPVPAMPDRINARITSTNE